MTFGRRKVSASATVIDVSPRWFYPDESIVQAPGPTSAPGTERSPPGRRETPRDCATRCPGCSRSRLLPGHECSRRPRQAGLSGSRRRGRTAEAAAADLVTSSWECRSCDGGGGAAFRPRAVSARTRNATARRPLCHRLLGRPASEYGGYVTGTWATDGATPAGGRSDDRGVAKLGHHARHHVVEIVAVKRPAAGIVGVKGDGDAAHWRHQDGIAHGTCERRAG